MAAKMPLTLAWPMRRHGARARQLLFAAADPWPGDAERGERLLAAEAFQDWGAAGDAEVHGFGWLRDLRAVGGEAARQCCRELILDWILRHRRRQHPRLWAPPRVADRVVHWIAQFDFYGKSAPQAFKAPFFESLADHALALSRALPRLAQTADRVRALHALVAFGVTVPGGRPRLRAALNVLRPLLAAWPAHGMVAERNPSQQLAVLCDLVDIAALLATAREPMPALDEATGAAGRALAALRHGDGGLALFHGGAEEDARLVAMALTLGGAAALVPSRYSGGYERVLRDEALLIADTGAPPPARHDRDAHAGMLAFEFGVGPARLVVNCGTYRGPDPAWRDAGRLTASHSTLVLGDRNSVEVEAGGGLRHRAVQTTADRQEDGGANWIAGSHDGYLRRFGVLHRRRLFLASDGGDLRGEDRLVPPPGRSVPKKSLHTPFAIRFHLHPDVFVGDPEPAPAGVEATIVPFGCDESGPWELVAEAGLGVSVEESFYLGRGDLPRKSHQIVLAGRIERETGAEARWAIRRQR